MFQGFRVGQGWNLRSLLFCSPSCRSQFLWGVPESIFPCLKIFNSEDDFEVQHLWSLIKTLEKLLRSSFFYIFRSYCLSFQITTDSIFDFHDRNSIRRIWYSKKSLLYSRTVDCPIIIRVLNRVKKVAETLSSDKNCALIFQLLCSACCAGNQHQSSLNVIAT